MKNDLSAVIAGLPHLPGVYQFQDSAGKVLYVGKAIDLKKRVASYFQKHTQPPRIALMLQAAVAVDTIITGSEAEALLLENNLIKSLKPRYNILFRDDKSYPLLCLSKHAYPRLMFYRGTAKDNGDFFGPFPNTRAVRETIDILQRVFQLRTCSDNVLVSRTRPCLLHNIGRCSAPCTNQITPTEYNSTVEQARRLLRGEASQVADTLRQQMEAAAARQSFEEAAVCRDRLRALATIRARHFVDDGEVPDADYVGVHQNGNRACINIVMVRGGRRIGERRLFSEQPKDSSYDEIACAFLAQHYQQSPAPERILLSGSATGWQQAAPGLIGRVTTNPRGTAKERLLAATDNARHALTICNSQQSVRHQQLDLLAKYLSLLARPHQLDCFDVSHSMGEETVAARVVFREGKAYQRAYRLYNIKNAVAGDDIAAIGEAVRRCYRRVLAEEDTLPDVIFIDGGVHQINAAKKALSDVLPEHQQPPLFGIAKGVNRRPGEETIIRSDGEIYRLSTTNAALHLMQALRDEAHRFAITNHRRRRDKKRSKFSALDGIEGIGPEKQRLLMTTFGGLSMLRVASTSDLVKVPGVGSHLAARIYRALHR